MASATSASSEIVRVQKTDMKLEPIVRGDRGPRVTLNDGFLKIGRGLEGGSDFFLMTNYLQLSDWPTYDLHRYHINFSPKINSTPMKKKIMECLKHDIGVRIMCDGEKIYSVHPIPMEKRNHVVTCERELGHGTTEVIITIRPTGYVLATDVEYLQFLNIAIRHSLGLTGMEQVGKLYYDPEQAIRIDEYRIEIWRGVKTAVRNHDAGVLLSLEPKYKVLIMAPVLDLLNTLKRNYKDSKQYEAAARKALVGTSVLAHYDHKYYCIHEIDFTMSPRSKFRREDGTETNYMELFERQYGVKIMDEHQPMLISLQGKRVDGMKKKVYLIPALCNPGDLSPGMMKNKELMAKINGYITMEPIERKKMLDGFLKKMKETGAVRELSKWDIKLEPDFVYADGRKLPFEDIFMGPEESPTPVKVDASKDWTIELEGRGILFPMSISDWILFVPSRAFADYLVTELQIAGRSMNLDVDAPTKIVEYRFGNKLPEVIRHELEKSRSNHPASFVFVVLPDTNTETYGEVKRICTLEYKVASQCMLAERVVAIDERKKDKFGLICKNMVVQITTKLRGVPWSVKICSPRIMTVGLHVQKCSARKDRSVAALVSTTNQTQTQYLSTTSFHSNRMEHANNLLSGIKQSLEAYRIDNDGAVPNRIVVYRNGDGEGEINFVLDYEIPRLKQGIMDFCKALQVPVAKLSVLIVNNAVNCRVLLAKSGVELGYENVPPGTVVDNVFTLPERYDFFLASQPTRSGTARLMNYNIVYDDIKWASSSMQQLTYKLCHLCYNRCGTVAIPAPIMYARKLANLTVCAVNSEAPIELSNKLWYL